MPNVVANDQVAHIWAHQAQDEARSHNRNFWFDGRKIYSYQTPVAHLVPDHSGELVALITSRTYGVTTSGKHVGPLYRALGYGSVRRYFTVPFIGAFGGRNTGDRNLDAVSAPEIHAANLESYAARYRDALATLGRKRDFHHSSALALLNAIANPAADYAEAFALAPLALDTDGDAAALARAYAAKQTPAAIAKRERAAAGRAAAKERKEAREAAARFERDQDRRASFYAGTGVGYGLTDATGGALLRVKGDTLQTSLGAEVPLAHAIKAFRFVKLCRERGETWTRNGRTIRVGHFQVDRIEASGNFVAGCHRINWHEVARLAILLGLDDVEPSAEAVEPSARAA